MLFPLKGLCQLGSWTNLCNQQFLAFRKLIDVWQAKDRLHLAPAKSQLQIGVKSPSIDENFVKRHKRRRFFFSPPQIYELLSFPRSQHRKIIKKVFPVGGKGRICLIKTSSEPTRATLGAKVNHESWNRPFCQEECFDISATQRKHHLTWVFIIMATIKNNEHANKREKLIKLKAVEEGEKKLSCWTNTESRRRLRWKAELGR